MFPIFSKEIKNELFFLSSEEETFTVTSVRSAHEVGSFKGLQLKHILSTFETVQLINGSLVKRYVIKSRLPWHIIGTVAFFVDSNSLKNRLDIGIDAWRWEVYKTQTSSTAYIREEAMYSVRDKLKEHQIVKRYYKCADNHEFKRQILAIYPLRYQCKSRKNPYEFCRINILISYISPSETSIVKPCSKVRTYESVFDQIKHNIQTGNGPTRASRDLENIQNQSLVPRRSQAFEENRNLKKTTTRGPLETTSNQAKRRRSDRSSYN